MRFLVDECCPRAFVEALRALSADVAYVAERSRGVSDAEVMKLAADEQRIIVTQDYDFGELAVRWNQLGHGVVLVACPALPVPERALRLVQALKAVDTVSARLTIVEPKRVRQRAIEP